MPFLKLRVIGYERDRDPVWAGKADPGYVEVDEVPPLNMAFEPGETIYQILQRAYMLNPGLPPKKKMRCMRQPYGLVQKIMRFDIGIEFQPQGGETIVLYDMCAL